jgi:hypothetical protein
LVEGIFDFGFMSSKSGKGFLGRYLDRRILNIMVWTGLKMSADVTSAKTKNLILARWRPYKC